MWAGAWRPPPLLTTRVWNVQMFPRGLWLAPRPRRASGLGSGHPPPPPAWAEGETEAAEGSSAGPSTSPAPGGDALGATRAQEGPCPWAPHRAPLPSALPCGLPYLSSGFYFKCQEKTNEPLPLLPVLCRLSKSSLTIMVPQNWVLCSQNHLPQAWNKLEEASCR